MLLVCSFVVIYVVLQTYDISRYNSYSALCGISFTGLPNKWRTMARRRVEERRGYSWNYWCATNNSAMQFIYYAFIRIVQFICICLPPDKLFRRLSEGLSLKYNIRRRGGGQIRKFNQANIGRVCSYKSKLGCWS